jgi:hypothetical protein
MKMTNEKTGAAFEAGTTLTTGGHQRRLCAGLKPGSKEMLGDYNVLETHQEIARSTLLKSPLGTAVLSVGDEASGGCRSGSQTQAHLTGGITSNSLDMALRDLSVALTLLCDGERHPVALIERRAVNSNGGSATIFVFD